jgi:hypothetical protein
VKAFLGNPWVITFVCGLVVAWIFRPRNLHDALGRLPPVEIGPFVYKVTGMATKRSRPLSTRGASSEPVERLSIHVEVVNQTNTAGFPRQLEAMVTAADGRRFPMTGATGPAFENAIFPGESSKGTLRFVMPSHLVITELDLRDPSNGAEKAIVLDHIEGRVE